MPEMIRKPIEPIKVGSGVIPPGIEQGGEMPRSATTSTSATPATSAAASPAPTLNSQDESKDKEVGTPPYFDFVNCALLCTSFFWHMTSYILVHVSQHFGEAHCLCLQNTLLYTACCVAGSPNRPLHALSQSFLHAVDAIISLLMLASGKIVRVRNKVPDDEDMAA